MTAKRIKHILFATGLLVTGVLMLNLYLSKNLERYLRKELSERTSLATNSFYVLSYDKLSISFFKGELSIQGIELYPDPKTFRKWESRDSLPSVYVRTKIKSIDFKGINLIWRWNYRTLRFDSFQIASPEISLFTPPDPNRSNAKIKYLHTKTLDELISPYIDTLSVKELDLENASITYTISNSPIPSIYALKQIEFHAYGFLLDKNSSQNGKLLYCDNFAFSAKEPQTIISNDIFALQTGNISLQTRDSVINIDNIRLIPQKELWKKKKQIPERYLEVYIPNILIQGIYFKREKAQSYLYAHTFDIASSEINLFKVKQTKNEEPRKKDEKQFPDPNPLSNIPSLYEIVSPVLHRVAVDHINIDDTKLNYTISTPQGNDFYKLNKLRLQSDTFLISPENKNNSIRSYFHRFILEASGIQGDIESQNQLLKLKRMSFDSENEKILLQGITLAPLSEKTTTYSFSGKIDSIYLDGLSYDSIITASRLTISSPDIQFIKQNPSAGNPGISSKHSSRSFDFTTFTPSYIPSFQIKKIQIEDTRIFVLERNGCDSTVYFSNDIHFIGTDITFKSKKEKSKQSSFSFKAWQLNFANFDNTSFSEKKYHIQIRKGNISSRKGLLFQDIQYSFGENDTNQILIRTPFLKIGGIIPSVSSPLIRISSIKSNNTDIDYINPRTQDKLSVSVDTILINNIFRNKQICSVNTIRLTHPHIQVNEGENNFIPEDQKTLHATSFNNILSHLSEKISLDTLSVDYGEIQYTHTKNCYQQKYRQDSITLSLNGVHIKNSENKLELDNFRLKIKNINIPLDHGFYSLKVESLDWNTDSLQLNRIHFVSPYSMMEFAYKQPQHKDWFDLYVENLSFNGIDYPRYFSEKTIQIGNLQINDIILQNFKNKQIEVPKRIIPMIYSRLQKIPVKIAIDTLDVNNMSVIYQELDPGRITPGKLFFTEMNGRFTSFTNIISHPDQYITLNVGGKLMDKGKFKAIWQLPVDSLNNKFLLKAALEHLDLPVLNQIITPLTSARILSGQTNDVNFEMNASDTSGNIRLTFPFQDLKIDILKEKDGDISEKVFVSRIANWAIKQNNPSEKGQLPRTVDMQIIRNPYHSTFNYLWQMLRPALTESIGITKTEQKIATEGMHFIQKIKQFFHIKKKKEEKKRTNP